MAFPSSMDSFTTKVDNTDTVVAAHVNSLQTAIVAIENKVGYDSDPDTTTHDYRIDALEVITTRGDLVVGNSSNNPSRLARGTSGYIVSNDGSDITWVKADTVQPALPQGYINGFQMNRNAATTEDLDIGVGQCRSSANEANGLLAAAVTKRTDATWASGTGSGGMASGLTATVDTFYHVHALIHPTSGACDVGLDTSLTAVNLLADAAVIAAGYTKYRRIGSIRMESSGSPIPILEFLQVGDCFRWFTPIMDVDETGDGSYNTRTLDYIPTGIRVVAFGNFYTNGNMQIKPVGLSDGNPALSSSPLSMGYNSPGRWDCITNTSAQISVYSANAGIEHLTVEGWHDFRGQNGQ